MSVLAGRIVASTHCNPPAQEVTLKVMGRSTFGKVDVRADGIGLSSRAGGVVSRRMGAASLVGPGAGQ
jgi:hypothetical protein